MQVDLGRHIAQDLRVAYVVLESSGAYAEGPYRGSRHDPHLVALSPRPLRHRERLRACLHHHPAQRLSLEKALQIARKQPLLVENFPSQVSDAYLGFPTAQIDGKVLHGWLPVC